MTKIILDPKTLARIKDFNPIDKCNNLGYYKPKDLQTMLIIAAYTDYLKTLGLLKDVELEYDIK